MAPRLAGGISGLDQRPFRTVLLVMAITLERRAGADRSGHERHGLGRWLWEGGDTQVEFEIAGHLNASIAMQQCSIIGQCHVDALKVSLARADQPPVGVLIPTSIPPNATSDGIAARYVPKSGAADASSFHTATSSNTQASLASDRTERVGTHAEHHVVLQYHLGPRNRRNLAPPNSRYLDETARVLEHVARLVGRPPARTKTYSVIRLCRRGHIKPSVTFMDYYST